MGGRPGLQRLSEAQGAAGGRDPRLFESLRRLLEGDRLPALEQATMSSE